MPINRSKPVLVYRNLRHGRKSRPLYSVCQDGRVVSHVHSIMLRDARFIVRESGRQRVLKENRKNVHAFIKGSVTSSGMGTDKFGRLPVQVVYNPYDVGYFFTRNTTWSKELTWRVSGARTVILNKFGCTAAYMNNDEQDKQPTFV